jgi:hypothetical protein
MSRDFRNGASGITNPPPNLYPNPNLSKAKSQPEVRPIKHFRDRTYCYPFDLQIQAMLSPVSTWMENHSNEKYAGCCKKVLLYLEAWEGLGFTAERRQSGKFQNPCHHKSTHQRRIHPMKSGGHTPEAAIQPISCHVIVFLLLVFLTWNISCVPLGSWALGIYIVYSSRHISNFIINPTQLFCLSQSTGRVHLP